MSDKREFEVIAVHQVQANLKVVPGKWWVLLKGWDAAPLVGEYIQHPAPNSHNKED